MSSVPVRWRLFVSVFTAIFAISIVFVTPTVAKNPQRRKPDRVTTASDASAQKLHPSLQARVDAGEAGTVPVFVTAMGGGSDVASYLQDAHIAPEGSGSLIVGRIPVQNLLKLASLTSVMGVGPVDFSKTGSPLGVPDPELNKPMNVAALRDAMSKMKATDVPYSKAPKLKGSQFDEMKDLPVGDQATHNFNGAWDMGYTGDGVTVAVLDGGTDFAHPDLLGTWQVWSGISATNNPAIDPGWTGWPKAMDAYDTLVLLLAPEYVGEGLTWYTPTTAAAATTEDCNAGHDWGWGYGDDWWFRHRHQPPKKDCDSTVTYATLTGPSRNFNAPAGTAEHSYTFPSSWSKSGTVYLGSHPDDHLLAIYGERPAFLLTDPHKAGVYDTVYVDLDDDYSFADEKPVTKQSPASYRDMNGDGYADISGGLLYYIADGTTRIPGGPTEFGIDTPPAANSLLAWTGDFDPAIEGHGTLTASNIVGQAVISGQTAKFKDIGRIPAAVVGGAPDARLAPSGDIYFSLDFSTQFSYFMTNDFGVDVTSNSYGKSDVDNDGWDVGSQEADWTHYLGGGMTTPLFSTGNGAPGYGTTTEPAPTYGINVGASTQFGMTGWDSIVKSTQVTDNQVMVWSNRGPEANGATGVDVVADGAFSAGDITLNAVLNGNTAWETWGGTSRSTPVAAGATALIYEAYRHANGSIPEDFALTAKEILKSSAQDLGYDPYQQGAGSVDAGQAVKVALGKAASVSPSEWRPGDYRGDEYPVMTNIIAPGQTDAQTFSINGPGTFKVSDRYLTLADSVTKTFTTSDVSKESPSNFNAPDYLIDITNIVKAHPKADLMVVRANFPYADFDTNGDYTNDNVFRLLTYNWTDLNHDHRLWTDKDHDGVVDHVDKTTSSNIDGFLDINFAKSEIEQGEYERFMYHRPGANTLEDSVRDPYQQMASGMFIGLQHNVRTATVPTTTFDIKIDFYQNVDWPWVSTPHYANGSFTANISVPDGTPYGMYEGAIELQNSRQDIIVPVSVAVAPTLVPDADGNLPAVSFGGSDVASAQSNLQYNNGAVYGASDWTWREESGDWRFFFFDVGAPVPDGTLFMSDTTWQDAAPHTDLDTILFGPSVNPDYQLYGPAVPFGAPYILDTVGKSQNTNIGAGVWTFNTATGGAEEFVTGPASSGLHAVLQHQVLFEGDKFWAPFKTTIGTASVSPSAVDVTTSSDSGGFDVTFTSGVDLPAGLAGDAFGLSQPTASSPQGQQDDPNDPSSAHIKVPFDVSHASSATITMDPGSDDFDLFLVYDANNDGNFTTNEIVASSTNGAGISEFINVVRPPDGHYQVWVQGWQVSGTPNVDLGINVVQGNDLTITPPLPGSLIPAGTPVNIHVDFSKSMTAGESYEGAILMGPPTAPTALTIPITVNRTP